MGGTQSKCSGKHVYFSLFLTSVMLIAQRLAAYSARAVSTSAQTAVGSCTRKLRILNVSDAWKLAPCCLRHAVPHRRWLARSDPVVYSRWRTPTVRPLCDSFRIVLHSVR